MQIFQTNQGPLTQQGLLNTLMYSSYKAQREYGMSHEATVRIGLGTEALREQYEAELQANNN